MSTYNLNAVMCTVGGVLISGGGESGLVKIEWNADQFTLTKGAGGSSVRSKLNDQSAIITFMFMPGDIGNATLMSFWALDRVSGLGAVPFALRDPSSNDHFTSPGIWVKRPPNREYNREVSESEWVCETGDLIAVFGVSTPSNI